MNGTILRGALPVATVALMLFAAACAAPGRPSETAGIQTTSSVTFITSLAEEERRGLGEILRGFEEQSGIRVTMVQMESQDVVNQLKAKMAAGRMDVDLVAQ